MPIFEDADYEELRQAQREMTDAAAAAQAAELLEAARAAQEPKAEEPVNAGVEALKNIAEQTSRPRAPYPGGV